MVLPVLVLMAAGGAVDAPGTAPAAVVIATSRGQRAIPVSLALGHPSLAADQLSALLPMSAQIERDWATVDFAGQQFRFLLGAPLFQFQNRIIHLVGGAFMQRDSLYLPLQWFPHLQPTRPLLRTASSTSHPSRRDSRWSGRPVCASRRRSRACASS